MTSFKDFANPECRHDGCTEVPHQWNVGGGEPDPKLCWGHLTPAQRREQVRLHSALMERLARLEREPDCWSWPIPPEREYATEDEARAALSAWQHGRGCAICGDRERCVEDHDHATGLVRGKLCRSCNTREGMGHGTAPFVKYRERNPASILGVKVRYWSPWTGLAEPAPTRSSFAELRAAIDLLDIPTPESLRDT